jgi:putative hydrolase of the HAD superfamily
VTRGLIIDIGGVLARGGPRDAYAEWAVRLGLTRTELINAIYGDNDDTVLIGRVTEDEWWDGVVRGRLGVDGATQAALRAALAAGQVWDDRLVALLRSAKADARTAILSNAWPSQRARMSQLGLVDVVDELLLSCEIGFAKPDPRAFAVAVDRLGTQAGDTLFVDDTPGHVAVAVSLGLVGHVHASTDPTIAVIEAFLQRDVR